MFGCTSQRGLGALRSTIAVLLMTLLAPVVAWAQQDAGTLRVLIQDAGGVVPGASVVVTNTATNVSVTQVSNDRIAIPMSYENSIGSGRVYRLDQGRPVDVIGYDEAPIY